MRRSRSQSDAADTAFWRLVSAQGGTDARPFVIGNLPEWIETESNSRPELAKTVSIPVALNGQICGERDIDYFRFSAEAGQVIRCDVAARRLGCPLDPHVVLTDKTGQTATCSQDYIGDDPVIVMRAERAGNYLLRISNLSHRGDASFVYRINLEYGPHIRAVFPAIAPRGTTQTVEFLLSDGTDQPVVLQREIVFPDVPAGPFRWQDPSGDLPTVTLWVAEENVLPERESNGAPEHAQRLDGSSRIIGQFGSRMDNDRFTLQSAEQKSWLLICRAFPRWCSTLPAVHVQDVHGSMLASGRRIPGTDDGICRLEWTAPEDGISRIDLRDLRFAAQGGPEFQYLLEVKEALSEFSLEPTSDHFNLKPGESTKIPVRVRRSGGLNSAIDLKLTGLPAEIEFNGARIEPGRNETELILTASETVAGDSFPVQLVGIAEVNGGSLRRVASCPHAGHDTSGRSLGLTHLDHFHLNVVHRPLFRIFCSEAYQYAHRGSVFPYSMQVERLNGFEGEIFVQIGDRQNRDLDGIQMRTVSVEPGQTELLLPIVLPETMAINVQSQSQLYAQAYARLSEADGQSLSFLVQSEK